MNREIKFRGVHPDSKKIMDVCVIDWMHDEVYFEQGTDIGHSINKCNLVQYTGKTDYNNEEMYQKDIVEIPGSGRCVIDICPSYGVVAIDSDGHAYPLIDHTMEGDHPVKVGNVFENPELLDG